MSSRSLRRRPRRRRRRRSRTRRPFRWRLHRRCSRTGTSTEAIKDSLSLCRLCSASVCRVNCLVFHARILSICVDCVQRVCVVSTVSCFMYELQQWEPSVGFSRFSQSLRIRRERLTNIQTYMWEPGAGFSRFSQSLRIRRERLTNIQTYMWEPGAGFSRFSQSLRIRRERLTNIHTYIILIELLILILILILIHIILLYYMYYYIIL